MRRGRGTKREEKEKEKGFVNQKKRLAGREAHVCVSYESTQYVNSR